MVKLQESSRYLMDYSFKKKALTLVKSLVVLGLPMLLTAQAPAAEKSRLYEACHHLFTPIEKPLLFSLERDGKSALLFATVSTGAGLMQLPEFVLSAIARSKIVLTTSSPEIADDSFKAMFQDIDRGKPFQLEAKLGPKLGARYRSYLADEVRTPMFSYLRPEAALKLLKQSFENIILSNEGSVSRVQEISRIESALNPPLSLDDLASLADEMNLTLQVSRLACRHGARSTTISLPSGSAALEDEQGVREVARMLRRMDKVMGAGLELPEYALMSAADMDVLAQAMTTVFSDGATRRGLKSLLQAARQAMQDEGVLFNLPIELVGGEQGLLQLLKKSGFQVEQIATKAQWDEFRSGPGGVEFRYGPDGI